MIQIANMVLRQGEKDPFVRNVFTLQNCAPIVGSQVLSFSKEEELLKVTMARKGAGEMKELGRWWGLEQ